MEHLRLKRVLQRRRMRIVYRFRPIYHRKNSRPAVVTMQRIWRQLLSPLRPGRHKYTESVGGEANGN